MPAAPISVRPLASKADKKAFVDLAYRLNADDPNWVPPLKDEVRALITPGKNPWFEHAEGEFFLAERGGRVVGRISAQVDQLVLEHMGAGLGQWGMFEGEDEDVYRALIAAAEDWLRAKGMTRSMGPFSLGIWDEPGLLVHGHDYPPMVMMGHNKAAYQAWVEKAGYAKVKDLVTYDLAVDTPFPPLIGRIVASGEKNPRIRVRRIDKSRFDEEAAIILNILNDAWSDNWGFIPLTDSEIAFAGKKLKPIVFPDLIQVAELDGEPVAFMLTLPDLNLFIRDLKGNLFPFGWAKLLWRLHRQRFPNGRVALMGVRKRLQSSRLASQLAFMLIEYIRRAGVSVHGMTRGEIGWILDDNQGMVSIADAIESKVNRIYRIYEKAL
ncbi:N-acetyltransferase [Sphingosinicella sp. LHD-64]|uniref:N-acetyltransferase n=1 Tax=Sphingosinicella sp. LHD-64 TaxID=3072139 RepID=UPI00280D1034|nr:N-acetyltransferase [Sphingosinicella sp. LHD-64]MDQ8758154.1 N-acetyltransferase [Sphingosinicella sp. LHD-64]